MKTTARVKLGPKTKKSSFWDIAGKVVGALAAGVEESSRRRDSSVDRVRDARRDHTDTDDLVRSLEDTSWDDRRLEVVESFCSDGSVNLTCEAAASILETFQWDSDRLTAARMLFLCVDDPGNAFKMADTFQWDTSPREFNSR